MDKIIGICFLVFCGFSFQFVGAQIKADVFNLNSYTKIKCNSKADIVFILDSSSSVGDENFAKVLSFIVNLLEDADIDENHDIRVGLMTFSTDVTIFFHLGQHRNKQDLIEAIINIEFTAGSTNTADALLAMRTEIFNTKNGDRKRVPNMAIVITDGISNLNSDRTVTEAIRAHTAGIHVFAIGIGFTGYTPELRLMVTPPVEDNLFLVETFGELEDIRKAMFSRICEMSLIQSTRKITGQQLPTPPVDGDTCEHAFDLSFIASIKKTDNRHVRNFLKEILQAFDTGTNLARVALVKGPSKTDRVYLNQDVTTKQLLKYFENDNSISKNDPSNQLPILLRQARNLLFQEQNGDREDIPNIAVIIADEITTASLRHVRREARKLKSLGTHVILLSTAYRGRRKSLNSIPSKPHKDNKIMVRSIRKLQILAPSLGRHVCKVARKNLLATTHKDYIKPDEEAVQRVQPQWNFTEIGDACLGKADVIFVLDSSGSVGRSNFKLELDFVKNFSSYLNLNADGHRIALMSYSDEERVHIWFNQSYNIHKLSQSISKVRYHYGSTNLLSAIRRLNTDVFDQKQNPANQIREKVVVLVADGPSNVRNMQSDIELESTILKQKAVTIIGIAVNLRNTQELESVISAPTSKYLHKVPNFRELHGLIPKLVPPLCHGTDFCVNTECMSDGICVNLMNRYKCQCMPGYTGVHCQLKCNRPTDMVFLLDSSASIGEENFEHIKTLTKGIVSHLNKYSCDYQIAAMKYGSTAIPQFYFNDYSNLSTLSNAIDGISFSYGYTNTAEAIRVARKTFFTKERGNRLYARDIIFIITDGLDNIRSKKLFEEARLSDAADIAIVPVGVNLKDKTSINSLASTSDGLFFVNKFIQLENLTETVVDYMVKSEDMCQYNPCKNGGLCQPRATSFHCSCTFGWNGQLCQSRCSPQVSILFAMDTTGHVTWDVFYAIKKIFLDIFSGIQKIDKQTPIGVVSISTKIRTESIITPNLTYPLANEVYNGIRLRGDVLVDTDIASKLSAMFTDKSDRDKIVIFMGSNKTIKNLPLHNIISSGLDVLLIGLDKADRVNIQFVPRYSYNGLNEKIVVGPKHTAEQVIALLCDSSNECSSRPCGLRGLCVDGRMSYSCTCFEGYSGAKCERGCPTRADLAFLIDSSGSVGRRNFLSVQEFVSQIVGELSIGDSGSKISVTTFSSRAKVSFYLNEHKTKEDVIHGIMNTRYHYGDTNTADGLEVLRNDVFTDVYGDRKGVQNIAILITDGLSNVRSFATLSEAEMTKDDGIHIFSIGVNLYDTGEVTAIASYPHQQNTFTVSNFKDLLNIVDDLVTAICEDADSCERNPCENDGKCEDHVNAFTCHCPSGYSGPLCAESCLSEVDLVFVVDTSTSVGELNFERCLQFINNITNILEIDHGNARIALITFSDYISVWFNLNSHKTKADIKHELDSVGYYNGAAFTSEALRIMREEVYSVHVGDRPDVQNHCILITDSVSNILPQKTVEEATKLHHLGIKVTAIAVGLEDKEEIIQIASNKENLFSVASYKELYTLVQPVLDIVCSKSHSDTQTLVQYIDSNEIQSDVISTGEMLPLDVAFVVDSTGSVGRYNFSKILSFIEYFIQLLYSKDIKYSILTCSNPVKDYFSFDSNYNLKELRQLVMNIPYIPGQLDLPSALQRLDSVIFSHKNGDRKNASNIGILIIDGFTNDLRPSMTFAKQCKEKGITLYIVTIAIRDTYVLSKITGSKQQVIQLQTYDELINAAKLLTDRFMFKFSSI